MRSCIVRALWHTERMINRKSAIQSIDVRDLPEPDVAVLYAMTEVLRRKNAEIRQPAPRIANVDPVRTAGTLKSEITREEIYRDVG